MLRLVDIETYVYRSLAIAIIYLGGIHEIWHHKEEGYKSAKPPGVLTEMFSVRTTLFVSGTMVTNGLYQFELSLVGTFVQLFPSHSAALDVLSPKS
jgi:hypothetical protein